MAMMREKAQAAAARRRQNRESQQKHIQSVNNERKNQLIAALRDRNRELELTVEHLRHILREHDISLPESDLHDIVETEQRPVGRPGYDREVLEFAQIIRNAAPRVLDILRSFPDLIPQLPSNRTVNRAFRDDIELRMEQLKDKESIPEILKNWRIANDIPAGQTIPVVLSVDAVNFKPCV